MAVNSDESYLKSDFSGYLSPEQAGPIFQRARESSIVQQMARQVPMGPNGVSIPHFTGEINANWTDEGGAKPISKGGLNIQTMEPKKLAAIFVASAEIYRQNPGNFIEQLRAEVAEAFAKAFDAAVLHGDSTPFTAFIDQTSKSVPLNGGENVYLQFNEGLDLLVQDDKELTGFLLDTRAEPIVNAGVDANNRPLFLDTPVANANVTMRPGRLMGRSSFIGEHVYDGSSVVGYGGDWSQVAWGVVGGINYDVSQETTLPIGDGGAEQMISLWQHNLVAVRAEAEYGALVNDPESFVQYTNLSS